MKGFLSTEGIKGSKNIELKVIECVSIYTLRYCKNRPYSSCYIN